jgi:hypothetical protein
VWLVAQPLKSEVQLRRGRSVSREEKSLFTFDHVSMSSETNNTYKESAAVLERLEKIGATSMKEEMVSSNSERSCRPDTVSSRPERSYRPDMVSRGSSFRPDMVLSGSSF